MAKARTRRRRKHRGTQGGRVDQRARKPRTRAEARSQLRTARKGRKKRRQISEPTWRGAAIRAAAGAALFFALMLLLFKQSIGPSVALAAVMFLVYLPLSYTMDRFFSRRARAKLERKAD